MAWNPEWMRAQSLSDFAAAIEGFRAFHGAKDDGPALSDEEVADLRAFAFDE